jgi:hypothetical protein
MLDGGLQSSLSSTDWSSGSCTDSMVSGRKANKTHPCSWKRRAPGKETDARAAHRMISRKQSCFFFFFFNSGRTAINRRRKERKWKKVSPRKSQEENGSDASKRR